MCAHSGSSKSFATAQYAAEIDDQRMYAAVEIVPAESADGNPVSGLTPMRDWMADRSDAIVCVGGAWWDINKANAGVPNELDTMLELGKPGFVAAGFGGAIAGYLNEDPSLIRRLKTDWVKRLTRSLRVALMLIQLSI